MPENAFKDRLKPQHLLFGQREQGPRPAGPRPAGPRPTSTRLIASERGAREIVADLDRLGHEIEALWAASNGGSRSGPAINLAAATPNTIPLLLRRDKLIAELQRLDPEHEQVLDWIARY